MLGRVAPIRLLMQQLSAEERLIFTLFYGFGYTEKDLKEMLGVPLRTVKSCLSHARSRLGGAIIEVAREVIRDGKLGADFWGMCN